MRAGRSEVVRHELVPVSCNMPYGPVGSPNGSDFNLREM